MVEGILPWPLGAFPRQGACTGGSHLWLPGLRLTFQKRSFSCENLVGAVGFEPTNPSLVRRNTVRIAPSFPGGFMHLNCANHAGRCPGVPGKVCTVVPASGSRSSIGDRAMSRHRKERPPAASVDPSPRKRVGLWRRGDRSRARLDGWDSRCSGRPEWLCPDCDAPNCDLHWHVTESGYGCCPAATARAWIRAGLERAQLL
jgi:hypothetical protein